MKNQTMLSLRTFFVKQSKFYRSRLLLLIKTLVEIPQGFMHRGINAKMISLTTSQGFLDQRTVRNDKLITRCRMLLTIDIGNTNLTIGLYQGETLGPRWRLATDHERMPDEYGLQFLGMLEHAGHTPADLIWHLPGIGRPAPYRQDRRSLRQVHQLRTAGGRCRGKNRGARALRRPKSGGCRSHCRRCGSAATVRWTSLRGRFRHRHHL